MQTLGGLIKSICKHIDKKKICHAKGVNKPRFSKEDFRQILGVLAKKLAFS